MRQDLTYIAVVLDESGSMAPYVADTLGGLNKFIEDQKTQPGECKLTLTKFSTRPKPDIFTDKDLREVAPLTEKDYHPGGLTALLDALGQTVDSLGARLASLPEEQRPGKVIVVVQTDGQENSSMEYTLSRISDMVAHQSTVYSWEFVFMGANVDAFAEAGALGFDPKATLAYDLKHSNEAYTGLSNYCSSSRAGNAVGFTMHDRDAAKGSK